MAGGNSSKQSETDEFLKAYSSAGDPEGDACVVAVGKLCGDDPEKTDLELRRIIGIMLNPDFSDAELHARVPEPVRAYLKATGNLPDWADPQRIANGQEFFYRNGLHAVTLLFFSSLPEGYACERPARVLVKTGEMDRGIKRRILRTAQFLIDVMNPGDLQQGGFGVRSAQAIRLVHAVNRPRHREAGADVPISQEEIAGTLYTFSILILDGLVEHFGYDLEDQETRDYLHAWNVVGYVMGVPDELLKEDPEEARALFRMIKGRLQHPGQHGVQLTRALVEFLHDVIPGERLDGIAETMLHYVLGNNLALRLGIQEGHWTENFLPWARRIGWLMDEAGDRSTTVARILGYINLKMIAFLLEYHCEGGPPLRVPRERLENWGLDKNLN